MAYIRRLLGGRIGLLLLCTVLTLLSARQIDGGSIKGDATQNLHIAHNLLHTGRFTLLSHPDAPPTSFREPLPPAVLALYLKLMTPPGQTMGFESLHYGENTRFVKLSNLLWIFLGLLGSGLLFRQLCAQRWMALPAMALTAIFFFHNKVVINSLYTELPAGTFLLWSSWALLRAMASPTRKRLLLAGALCGLLCLTKAVFLYAAPLVMLLTAWLWLRGPQQTAPPRYAAGLRFGGLMLLGFALVVGPWLLRNQLLLNSLEVSSGRSGYVLFKRALLDQISDAEFKAGFYLFGPNVYQQAVAGTSLQLLPGEATRRDGRAARLNGAASEFLLSDKSALYAGRPDHVVSFYNRSAAVYVQLVKIFKAGHHPQPEAAADRLMQKVALRYMLAHPLDHLKTSVLLFWRGFWCISPISNIPFTPNREAAKDIIFVTNVASGLALLVVFGLGLRRTQHRLAVMAALPLAMMGVYTLLSQNLPRFTAPALPLMLLSLLWMLHLAAQALWRVVRLRWRPLAPAALGV